MGIFDDVMDIDFESMAETNESTQSAEADAPPFSEDSPQGPGGDVAEEESSEVEPLVQPYLTPDGCLIIPFASHPRYHYWKRGGQHLHDTLREMKASPEVLMAYGVKEPEAE